ncbi:hypothetical protein CA984_12170 [Streptosporangium minutum]|uniref:Uncharacterized protein n=1 Tax=Streptosporangium minutum TaxID=569862 RepID=A0A243RQ93_9ACTN|nr:hypothetical protein CA984_12170 [Streptosporangium minutum]
MRRGVRGGAVSSAAGPRLAALGRLKYSKHTHVPHGSQPSGASRSSTLRRRPDVTSSLLYSHCWGCSGSRALTNRPFASTLSTSQPCAPYSLSILTSWNRSAVQCQARASAAGSAGGAEVTASSRASSAAGPNSSSGSPPLSAR